MLHCPIHQDGGKGSRRLTCIDEQSPAHGCRVHVAAAPAGGEPDIYHAKVSHFSARTTKNAHAIEVPRTISNSCETESVGYKSVITEAT
jgi:hypothetical protein